VICLVDSDIIYKLAVCNLLDDTLAALDSARADAYVLPTAKYRFGIARRRSDIGEQRYGVEVFARIRDFIVPASACDIALSVAFGSGWDATESNVRAALDSYIYELRSLPINLLTDVD
jgi:hypothetical protein